MENQFTALGISEEIVKSITEMGFSSPTAVQEQSIPAILKGRDLIVMSKTGSGKTGAFGIPMIEQIEEKKGQTQALILTPTRELAVQVDHDLRLMSRHKKISLTAVFGQHNMNVEIQELEKGVSVVTGTPGRVFDHIQQGNLKTGSIRFLVLDEADRMLDMGFIDQVVRIIKTLPKDRITLLFSATMPAEIQNICRAYMKDPEHVSISSDTKTVDSIRQTYFRVEPNEKRTQLDRLLKVEQPDSCMVFCNTRIAVDKVQAFLSQRGYTAEALHGANSQNSRLRTINGFKKGEYQILVATDVAARGIHIDDLSLVINYDIPVEKDSYVHRIGRTGRAGSGGKAFSLVTSNDIMSLYEIEEHVGALIEEEELPTDEAVAAAVASAALKTPKYKPRPQTSGRRPKPEVKVKSESRPKSELRPKVESKSKSEHRHPNADGHVSRQKSTHSNPPKTAVKSYEKVKEVTPIKPQKENQTGKRLDGYDMTDLLSRATIVQSKVPKKKSVLDKILDLFRR